MEEFYSIYELDPSWVCADEAMGSKDKNWFQLPEGERWLFKYPRVNNGFYTGEHWAEKIAAEIAELLGVPHAKVELACFEGRLGSLTQRFPELTQEVEMVHGNDLLSGYVLKYDREKRFRQSDHTIQNILSVVAKVISEKEKTRKAYHILSGMMMLDALILNTDRHHENWALLRKTKNDGSLEHWIAPSFDHASSLGRELTEDKLEKWELEPWRVEWYAKRAHGAIFLSKAEERGCNPLELAMYFRKHYPSYCIKWIERLRELTPENFEKVVRKVPPEVMTMRAKRFTLDLLSFTQTELCKDL